MRELKFRAWDTVIKRYVDYEYETTFVNPNGFGSYGDRYIWEQYTGLKDKNGKEIYEGDIVEASIDGTWATGKNSVSFGKVKWKLEVIYNDIRFMDVFKVIGSKNAPDRIYYLFDKELSELEVIGNIYDDPDLLEQENAGN